VRGALNVDDCGAVGDGVANDDTAFSCAVQSGAATIELSNKTYRLEHPLDLSSSVLNGFRFLGYPITIRGKGACQYGQLRDDKHSPILGTPKTCSMLLGTTGSSIIDTSGSQRVTLQDLALCAATDCSPVAISKNKAWSTVGIVMGRLGTPGHPDIGWAAFHDYERVTIFMGHHPSANKSYGSIGIYNAGAEHWDVRHSHLIADTPLAMTAKNALGIKSIHDQVLQPPQSMALALLQSVWMSSFYRAPAELWDVLSVSFDQCYWARIGKREEWAVDSDAAISFNTSNIRNIRITGQVEETPTIARFHGSADHLDISVLTSITTGVKSKPYLALDRGVKLHSSRFSIQHENPIDELQNLVSAEGENEISSSQIWLHGNGKSAQRFVAPNVLVKGTMIYASRVPIANIGGFATGSSVSIENDEDVIGSSGGLSISSGYGVGTSLWQRLTIGAGDGTAGKSASLRWGNGSGYSLDLGDASGPFSPKYSLYDDGRFVLQRGATVILGGPAGPSVSTGDCSKLEPNSDTPVGSLHLCTGVGRNVGLWVKESPGRIWIHK
jgi:hypothetical protein